MPSFDIVSEIDRSEVINSVDQANREIHNRFDFKRTNAKYELKEEKIIMKAEVDFQLKQMLDILKSKLTKRGVDLGHLKLSDPNIQYKNVDQEITLQEGIKQDTAKKITKFVKGHKMKVQITTQGNHLRVTGKKLDNLQEVITLIKEKDFGFPLDFCNYRK